MIVVRLMGGLGNQMFQYAAARALSHRLDTQFCYDTSYLGHAEQSTVRHFELHHFRCAGRPLDWRETLRFGSQYRAPLAQRALGRVVRKLQPRQFYEEPGLAFDPSFRSLSDNTILSGRFQSYRYFENTTHLLREDFKFARPISSTCRALCAQARSEQSVGIHVRRTDYVDNKVYRNIIQALPLDYYERTRAH